MDIREIAKRAKVSTATVSRTINHVPTVDPKLSKRVWKVVEELGYFPNTHARSLVSGKSRTFGLIVSEITNPFFPEIVQTFENVAVENNYEIILTSTVHDQKRMEIAVRRMIERRVDGVAVLTFGMEEPLLENLKLRKVPLVLVDVGPNAPGICNITINYESGIREAVQHLAALRHKRIAFVSGPLELKSAVTRKVAFETAMEDIGLAVAPELMIEGDHTMDGGIRAFKQLSQLSDVPTAVMCSNDVTAIGVMREAFELNISIPQELSVVGFDDIRFAQFMIPPLTTVRMSQSQIAELAFHALLNEVNAKEGGHAPKQLQVQTQLILRKSTALAYPYAQRTSRKV
jgi:LacI family transcriptional regulator